MTQPGLHVHVLPAEALDHLSTIDAGDSRLIVTYGGPPTPFTLLDCFDRSLQRSGRVLLRTGATIELFGDAAARCTQSCPTTAGFVSQMPDGPVKRALADISPLRSLLPVTTGEKRVATLALVDNEEKTLCRLHVMQLAGEQGDIVLIAPQALRGYDDALHEVLEHLNRLGARPASCTVVFDHLLPGQADYDPKPQIPFTGRETAYNAANRIIATHIPLLRAHESGIIADHDTEFLHDYRIQLRKIRSVLSLFSGVYDDAVTVELKARFSTLAAVTGELRDLDVYLLEKPHFYSLVPASLHEGLNTLFHRLERQRSTAKRRLSRHLRSPEYEEEITRLAKRFANPRQLKRGLYASIPVREFACERIWRRYRKARRLATRIDATTPDANVHELRIHLKKLRYLIEFFSSLFDPTELNRALKPMKRLQDNLGRFNDYSVQQEKLQDFLTQPLGNKESDRLQVAQSVGALIAVLHHRQLEERAQVMKNFKQFDSPAVRAVFRDLFQPHRETP